MTVVIDPTDENVAILSDGTVGHAMRVLPARTTADPNPPTMAELNAAPILGYGRFTMSEEAPDER